MRAAALSDIGRKREGNEDAFLVDERLGLYAVADGMGGHRAGEVASATALEALRAAVANGTPIEDAIVAANTAVVEKADRDPALRGMGTTVTAFTVTGAEQLLGQVGDSRAYLFRDGELVRLTEDHSLVEELVREGRITPEQAEVHPQRSIITRALGIERTVDVDVYRVQLRAGDRLVLNSDGLTSMVREPEIARILRSEPDPQRAAEALVAAANAAGGDDNVTVVVVEVVDASAPLTADDTPASVLINRTPTPVAAPEVEPPPQKRPPRPPRRTTAKRMGKALVVALPILVIFAVAVGAITFYARHTYYVGLSNDSVTVFQGRPGGVLGFEPTVVERAPLSKSALNPQELLEIQRQPQFQTVNEARAYVRRLTQRVNDRTAPPTTTTLITPTAPSTTRASTTTTAP